MQKHILTLLAITTAIYTFAQETVSMGAGYANQVFYSLENGEVSSSPVNNWDLAFQTSAQGSVILTNDGYGAELYLYNGSLNDFETLDTTGISDPWKQLNNSDSSWNYGAFNQFEADGFDLGWGTYNIITHAVKGDSVYVLKTIDGAYKKLYIEKLSGGTYYIINDDLDNSARDTITVAKADYSTKNFVYYSFKTDEVIDREPASEDWDLTFTKYITELYPGTNYSVTGVLSNKELLVAKASGKPSEDLTSENLSYSTDIGTIGYDWKSFNLSTYQYDIEDSLAYFVKKSDDEIYKLVFTDFGGSSTGDFIFTQELVVQETPTDLFETENQDIISVYPNPSNGTLYFPKTTSGNLEISNAQGIIVDEFEINGNAIDISHLNTGVYFIRFSNGEKIQTNTITKL